MTLASVYNADIYRALKAGELFACKYYRIDCENYIASEQSAILHVIQTRAGRIADSLSIEHWTRLVTVYGVDRTETLCCGCVRESIKLGHREGMSCNHA